jgi:DNA-directed RNA polymerase subunit H (RpoH/RPB5)
MNNFELIDDYLTDRLGPQEKEAFESKLASDLSFKADVDLQKSILESIKKVRAAELKAMLQKIPVGGAASFDFSALRMAAGIVAAGLLLTALAFYFKNGTTSNLTTSIEDSVIKKIDSNDFEPLEEPVAPIVKDNDNKVTEKPSVKVSESEAITGTKEKLPKIEAADPTTEMIDDSKKEIKKEINKSQTASSTVEVDVDSTSKKYSFHYQFVSGKLMLYGPFDKSLYEIIEINGTKHSVFMFYKDNYYSLNDQQSAITMLEPIKDKALVAKLSEYRAK